MDERVGPMLELAARGRRPRWRDGRVLVLVATVVAAAGAAVLADSRPDAVVESEGDAARRPTVALDDEVALSSPNPTEPAVVDSTTTTIAAPSTTAPEGPETTSVPRSTAPRIARIVSTPTTAAPTTTPTTAPTTTTTVDPHPYQPNLVYLKSYEERVVAGEEASVWFSADGILDHISYDFGDGSPVLSYDLTSSCNAHMFAGQKWHTWAAPGRYTVTVRVHGSRDCETRPDRYQHLTSTLTIDVVAPD